jgi:hypothetical protein
MAQLIDKKTGERDRALRILAKSLFRQLRDQGYQPKEILSLSTELIGLLTADLSQADQPEK